MRTPKTIAFDFDGVIHSYDSGWTGEVPTDPPVPGARESLATLRAAGYRVVVFSCRVLTAGGMAATREWLRTHGIEVDGITGIKPHAVLYVDDRAHRFQGTWDDVLAAVGRKPWNVERMLAEPLPPAFATPWVPPPAARCATCGAAVAEVDDAGAYRECGHSIPELAQRAPTPPDPFRVGPGATEGP